MMNYRLLLPILLLFTFTGSNQALGEQADFLIVENTAYLLVYNKYQQRITFRKSRQFLPYQPLQILEENIFLSDGYTPCMKVKSGSEIYFVIKDQESDLANESELGYYQIFRNCTVLGDTVEILNNQVIFLAKIPTRRSTPQSKKYFLEREQRLLRLFSKDGFSYVQKLGSEADFGWSNLTPDKLNSGWRIKTKTTQRSTNIPPEISRRIEGKIREVNYILEQLFAYFNLQTAQLKNAPQWEIEFSETRISYALNDPDYRENLQESTRYLLIGLESVLLGTPYGVFYHQGKIEVKRR